MPGLRIRHTDPRVRSCIAMIPAPRKNLHVPVDGEGYADVSFGVWEDLELSRRLGVPHGFEKVDVNENPPDLIIGTRVMTKQALRIEAEAIQSIAPRNTTVTIKR